MKRNMGIYLGFLGYLMSGQVMAIEFTKIIDVAQAQGNNYTQDFEIQSDGKALVSGYYYNTSIKENGSFILRYTAEGELDSSFGEGGVNIISNLPGGQYSTLNRLGVLSDGKILLAGQIIQNGIQKLLLVRLNANGFLDADFGSDGYLLTELTGIHPNVVHLTPQDDNAFFVTLSNKNGISILKFNADGSLNTDFANGGILLAEVSGESGSFSSSMAIQDDGKIVVVGGIAGTDYKSGFVARYDENGVIDKNFGSNGVVIYRSSSTSHDYLNDVSIQADGKIIMTGTSTSDENRTRMILLRYMPDGSIDTTFATNGRINMCPNYESNDCSGINISVKENGNILVGSQLMIDNTTFPLLYQFDQNGSLISNYGTDGSKVFDNVSPNFTLIGNRLDNEGNDVISGYALIDGMFKVVLTSQL